MNKYFLKYIKYKSKYINYIINYGGTTPEKKPATPEIPATPEKKPAIPATPEIPEIPATPIALRSVQSPPDSTRTQPGTPSFIQSQTVSRLILHMDDFVHKLTSCSELNIFKIKPKEKKDVDPELYINFLLNNIQFAHLSFHKEKELTSIQTHFDLSQFHLRVDKTNPPIFFNIEKIGELLVFVSIQSFSDIQLQLDPKHMTYLENLIICIEQILNSPEYYGIFINPVATQLKFD